MSRINCAFVYMAAYTVSTFFRFTVKQFVYLLWNSICSFNIAVVVGNFALISTGSTAL